MIEVIEIDTNMDGYKDAYSVRKKDYTIPLFGDYMGVELALVRFPPNADSREYAKETAQRIAKMLEDK